MKLYRFFKKEELIKEMIKLGYNLVQFTVEIWDEDDDNISEKFSFFSKFKKEEIKKISKQDFMWTTVIIELQSGEELKFYSDNINSDDETLLRYTHNEYFSPLFKEAIDSIHYSKELEEWLWEKGVNELTIYEDEIYETYLYKGIGKPLFDNEGIRVGIEFGDMELSEEVLLKGLNEISNKELARNIEHILSEYKWKI